MPLQVTARFAETLEGYRFLTITLYFARFRPWCATRPVVNDIDIALRREAEDE